MTEIGWRRRALQETVAHGQFLLLAPTHGQRAAAEPVVAADSRRSPLNSISLGRCASGRVPALTDVGWPR
jgi:hypothetical protein